MIKSTWNRITSYNVCYTKLLRASGLLERLVELGARAGHGHVPPELLAQLGYLLQGPLEARLVAGHAALLPHDLAQLAVEGVDRALALDREQPLDAAAHGLERFATGRVRGVELVELVAREVVADRVGDSYNFV